MSGAPPATACLDARLAYAIAATSCDSPVQNTPVPRPLSPSVSINSWNATSTSCYALDPVGRVRKAAVATNFNKLSASADVTLIQETKCNSAEGNFGKGALAKMATGCDVFYSNAKKGSAGVATLVRHSFLEFNVVTKVKLDPCLKGYVLALLITPMDAVLKPYTIFNIYLSSQDAAARFKQLKAIMLVPAPEFSFWGGDWNFITDPEDTSTTTFTDQPQNFLDLWSDFTSHFSLKEIYQPLHTYYHVCSDVALTTTRRLDRFYSSLTEADLAVTPATASTVFLPHSVISRFAQKKKISGMSVRRPLYPSRTTLRSASA